jgi:hypothetical protein
LILLAHVCCSTPALDQQVEVVRPTPRAVGMHGWTIEVPTPGAYGSFEVLRGGRLPDANAAEEAIPVAPPPAAAPAPPSGPTPPRTIQIAPVRPVAVAPVAPPEPFPARERHTGTASNVATDGRTVRVQRGPFALSPFAAAAAALGGASDPSTAGAPGGALGAPGAPSGALGGEPGQTLPPLPPGARVIRIR